MTKKTNWQEVISFYHDNGLEDLYSDQTVNRSVQKNSPKNPPNFLPKQSIQVKKQDNSISMISSTSQALSEIAKKVVSSKDDQFLLENSNNKFMSLNEIINSSKALANKASNIDELKNFVCSFEGCNLKKMATNTVFCDGNQNSDIMVIGEAPGNHEDLRGIPFCGDSGELLNSMFKSIGLTRDKNYYITNVIFWRPPGNRRPTDEELSICRPFVERHIELFKPKIIILVGATAMSAILNTNDTISSMRGKFIDFSPKYLSKSTKIFTIFHPSYLMRQPTKKKTAWSDMLKIKEFINQN